MTLITGSAIGSGSTNEDLYLEGAPNIFLQDTRATPLNNPDAQGFYWGISGTTAYPYLALGCINDVSLTENITMNDVICDTVGFKSSVQRRNYLEVNLTIQTLFPLTVLTGLLNGSAVTAGTGYEKMGIGPIDNNKFWRVYMPKVYDESVPGWIAITLHRAQLVDAWTINFRYGNNWQVTGLKIRGFANDALPSAQSFATIVRLDSLRLP